MESRWRSRGKIRIMSRGAADGDGGGILGMSRGGGEGAAGAWDRRSRRIRRQQLEEEAQEEADRDRYAYEGEWGTNES